MKAYDTFGRLLTSEEGYEHVQATPSSTWRVEHKLGYTPSAVMVWVGGRERMVSKRILDIDTLEIGLNSNLSGVAKVK